MSDEKSEIEQDMMALAELVYEISEKYGGIYVNATCCEGYGFSSTTYKNKDKKLVSADYWADKERGKCNS